MQSLTFAMGQIQVKGIKSSVLFRRSRPNVMRINLSKFPKFFILHGDCNDLKISFPLVDFIKWVICVRELKSIWLKQSLVRAWSLNNETYCVFWNFIVEPVVDCSEMSQVWSSRRHVSISWIHRIISKRNIHDDALDYINFKDE